MMKKTILIMIGLALVLVGCGTEQASAETARSCALSSANSYSCCDPLLDDPDTIRVYCQNDLIDFGDDCDDEYDDDYDADYGDDCDDEYDADYDADYGDDCDDEYGGGYDDGVWHDEDFPMGRYGRNSQETIELCDDFYASCPVFEVEDGDDVVMTHYAEGDFDGDGDPEYMLFGEQPTINTYFLIESDGTCLTYKTRDAFEEPDFYSNGMFTLAYGDWYGFTNTELLDENSIGGMSFYTKNGVKEYYGYPIWFDVDDGDSSALVLKGTHDVTFDQRSVTEDELQKYLSQLFDGDYLDIRCYEF